jgi:hypothetical protein
MAAVVNAVTARCFALSRRIALWGCRETSTVTTTATSTVRPPHVKFKNAFKRYALHSDAE